MGPPSTRKFTAWYRASSFPPSVVPTTGILKFTADDLAHALFTTGRAPGDQHTYGAASVWEMLHRTSLIPAYVRINSGDGLIRSRLALELDRSEKVALSYALGQAMTAVFCYYKLDVRYLMHVDRYANRFGVRFGASRVRADLFGQGPSGWVVAEAKGRSNSMESDLRQKLVRQTRLIISISGARPAIALGCVVSFPPINPRLRIDAVDPEDVEPEAVTLDVDLDRFLLAYYEPFITAVAMGEESRAGEFVMSAAFPSAGLQVGIHELVAERVRLAARGQVRGLSESIAGILDESNMPILFPDGTLVVTDWDDALTINDWEI